MSKLKLAVIPARGGSKRIPGKNVRNFCGRPIIEYSIQAALNSGVFDRVIVSTDSDEIADIAIQCGAEAPFKRPLELSGDHTPTIPVIAHAVNWLEGQGADIEYACCIYATAPFVEAGDLKSGLLKLSSDPEAEFLFPVTSFAFPIFRAIKIENDYISMVWPENELVRSQDLPEAFHDAGQFYWGTGTSWKTKTRLFSSRTLPLIVPRHRVQDIDTLEDWKRAESLFTAINIDSMERGKN